uniref:tRNA 2-thiocytidine biosynthesis protein ttcA n=1 Tax=Lepeophtheirus salmonis TaxID=72036 RepID=D3PFR8_LEPSM|nr:tRNA 2-thiocytidine biosynthesis protein ttcA [Lepeophtheirus salmonis]
MDESSDAETILSNAIKAASRLQVPDQRLVFSEVDHLPWFTLPIEAKEYIQGKSINPKKPIFEPKSYAACCGDECLSGSLDAGQKEGYSLCQKYLTQSFKTWLPKETIVQEDKVREEESLSSEVEKTVCITPRVDNVKPMMVESKAKWHAPPSKEIFKPFLEAMEQFSMIKNGDRVLVCLSGGKDSLSLLHTLRQYRFYAKETNGIEFDLGAVTVDPGSDAYDPRPLIPYLEELDIHYLYEKQNIMAAALEADCTSICSYCSRMKRGRIYAAARKEKYNVLAMGQHLDDLVESFIMSIFHNGRMRTMKANYSVKEKDLRVIRPFVYVRESKLREFAQTKKLPIIPENCPACFESPKERHRTKQLLAAQELLFPRLYWSLKSAMFPLMNIQATGIESKLFGGGNPETEEEEDENF